MPWIAGQRLQSGKYVIETVLGQGGLGITYKALYVELNQTVVIKTPNEYLSHDPEYEKYIERFIQEGRTLARLSQDPHPHIVGVIDLFREGATYCLVMDFVEGENLYEAVRRRGALPEAEIVPCIRQIGEALMVVHQTGLVHRGVHPGDIMLRSDRKAVLIDFGIAQEIIPNHTDDIIAGNEGFAPYEQMTRSSREPTVDVYGLASTLYYAVTGQRPTTSLARKLNNASLKSPKQINPSISDGLNQAILKGMALEAKDRPQSMQAWLSLLSLAAPRDYHYRQILLNKVREFWVKGVLENSLRGKALIEVHLEERFDAVVHSWSRLGNGSKQLRQTLPSNTRIIDFFNEITGEGRTLLILGEPRVGKTTALLELARELIDCAEQNINQPIPVIFNLSSWKKRGSIINLFQNQTIADWLVQELKSQYQVSQSVSLAWVKNQQLLLLLDGLDEVRGNSQDACVQALNQFTQEYSMVDMVVTSRIRDYETLKHRLKFQSAIYLSPVIPENESQQATKEAESDTFVETTLTYGVLLTLSSQEVQLGGEIEVTVYLGTTEISNKNSYLLEILQNAAIGNELNVILNAPRFQLNSDNTASLPLDPDTAQETQTARFRLTALRPGSATITTELYRGDTFETKLETQIQVADIDEATFIPQRITTQPRPIPQPDFILRIQTIWNETHSTCKFQYQLKSFRFPSVFTEKNIYTSDSFSSSWIEQTRGLLATTLENISGSLPTEGKSRLISLGQYLLQHLFPTELQSDFRSLIPQNSTFTLLILADQEAWIPWELLYDGQRFFAERFIIGRWLQELNDTRPYEFPVGTVNVAHYANVEQPQLWSTLLEAPGAPLPQPLPAGVLHDSTEAMRGLHLIRYSQSSDADLRNAPVTLDNINYTEDIELQMRPAKLNLRRNRPFVTLSYVKTDAPELTALENTWASAFIRAGCSGFTGSLWAVEPAVEAAFISCFYNRLWAGASLGEAFYTSRQLARASAPDSLDWLAYVLFGDPMARPYRPVPGDGYAIVEPIGREIDDPLSPGAIARFRVTLRRNPPVWHEDRVIEVVENLVFENLQVHIVTYGLQVIPDLPVTMTLTAKGDYLGWFTLVVPNEITEKSALVQVYFADGMRPIHSLNFSLKIENGREE
ncbi:protein kinase [Calothrix sp. FACHB-156]|nr:protein kinase [Calothrix sp. FACHB-156]